MSTDCMKVTARHPPLVTILQSDQTTERGLLKVDTAHHHLLMVGWKEKPSKNRHLFCLVGNQLRLQLRFVSVHVPSVQDVVSATCSAIIVGLCNDMTWCSSEKGMIITLT